MNYYPIPWGVAILLGASYYRENRVTFVLCGPYLGGGGGGIAIALAGIRSGRILREKADCK